MRSGFRAWHWLDNNDKPAGGCTFGNGFTISWQNGPLGRGPNREEPNGAFVEDIIAAAHNRLSFYQQGEFACEANDAAMRALSAALDHLDSRTKEREARAVEGTHTP